jgi:hypothetical protein
MAQEIQSGLLTGSVILMHGYIHWAVAPGAHADICVLYTAWFFFTDHWFCTNIINICLILSTLPVLFL